MSALGLINWLPRWSLSSSMIHYSGVFMRYSGPLEAARLAVIQCKIHMRLSERDAFTSPLFWPGPASPVGTRSSEGCDVTASYQQQSEGLLLNRLIHLISGERFPPCLLHSISHVFHPPSLSPHWQWLMTLSCRELPRRHSHPSFSPLCAQKKKDSSGRIEPKKNKKTIDATCSQWGRKVEKPWYWSKY